MKKLCVILSLILATTSNAQDCTKCLDAVAAGEEYIKILEEQAIVRATITTKLEVQNDQLRQDLAELEQRQNAWYNSPFVMLGLGLLTGVVVSK
jgi:hypothetical protein